MHIEPGVVDGAKMMFSYGTAAAAAGYTVKLMADDLRTHAVPSFAVRTVLASALIFLCFEVLPHFAVGVSEVHFILGTTALLMFGAGAGALGLVAALALQGLVFAPTDLPMFTVNVTTLLFPLFAIHALAARIIPADKPYVDLSYNEVLKLSLAYQGGIVAWVAFWAIYGQGFGVMSDVMAFGAAYMLVVLIEPVADLAILAGVKGLRTAGEKGIFARRLHHAA